MLHLTGRASPAPLPLLLRAALTGTGDSAQPPAAEVAGIASFRPFPARGQVVTNDTIDRLRDEAGL